MNRNPLSLFLVGALVGLTSCSEGYASSDVKEPFNTSVIVLDGTVTGPVDTWSATLTIEDAPPGEYFLFVSVTRPTSGAGLAAFDPSTCGTTCAVEGLGDYSARSTQTAIGKATLNGSGLQTSNSEQFFIIARRTSTGGALTPVAVTGSIGLSDNSGCATPVSPTITASDL